jgi:nitroimidazol reductase NimA-like FMN-containing flavoprotein (pyridoxamine 5'-phosphate oxidase superfamily)
MGRRLTMLIHVMTEKECFDALEQTRVGRLACARDNQPYVVPIFFAYRGEDAYGVPFAGRHLYGFTTLGRKTEWMRENPLVCVETDKIESFDRWTSVVVSGRYEELPDSPEFAAQRATAHELLQHHGMWWQPGYVSTVHGDPSQALVPIYYRIRIEQVTGHRATPDEAGVSAVAEDAAKKEGRGWLHNILHPTRDNR